MIGIKKILAFIVVGLLLVGCGRADYTMEAARTQDTSKTTLSLLLPQTHFKYFLQELLISFEDDHQTIHIEPAVIPDNQWGDVVKAKVAVGETPDLIRIDKNLIIEIGTEHFVEFDNTHSWYDRIKDNELSNKVIKDKLYGLPVGATSSIGLIYNRLMFEKYNLKIPKTIDELRDVCDAFLAQGIVPLYASDKDSWTTQIFFSAAASQVVSTDQLSLLKSGDLHWADMDIFANILSQAVALRLDGYTNHDYLESTYSSAVRAVAQQNAAMYISGRFFITDVYKESPQVELYMVPVPYDGRLLTLIDAPGQISLFKSSKKSAEAEIFLNWFSQPENMDIFNAGWNHPSVYKDQKLQPALFQQILEDEFILKGKTVYQFETLLEGVDLTPFWEYQQKMIAGTMTPQEVLEKWDENFAKQIAE